MFPQADLMLDLFTTIGKVRDLRSFSVKLRRVSDHRVVLDISRHLNGETMQALVWVAEDCLMLFYGAPAGMAFPNSKAGLRQLLRCLAEMADILPEVEPAA